MRKTTLTTRLTLMAAGLLVASAHAVAQAPVASTPAGSQPAVVVSGDQVPPADYVIGSNDVLSVVFWRDETMTTDVVVRPDGKISLPLINEIEVIGLTPEELRLRVTELASKYVQDPAVSVVVKEINSRIVFITGNVGKPGTYPLMAPTTVMQLIAVAGGLNEWAKEDRIIVLRDEGGQYQRFRFNYKWVLEGKNPLQNIQLRPGDTVLVP